MPPGDPEALAKAIAALREDPARRAAMGEAGRAEVAAKRTWSRVAETYRDVYRSIAESMTSRLWLLRCDAFTRIRRG